MASNRSAHHQHFTRPIRCRCPTHNIESCKCLRVLTQAKWWIETKTWPGGRSPGITTIARGGLRWNKRRHLINGDVPAAAHRRSLVVDLDIPSNAFHHHHQSLTPQLPLLSWLRIRSPQLHLPSHVVAHGVPGSPDDGEQGQCILYRHNWPISYTCWKDVHETGTISLISTGAYLNKTGSLWSGKSSMSPI